MKKLIAIVLSVAMLLATSVTAFAVPADLAGVVVDTLGKEAPVVRNMDVPVNIKVDAGQTGTYVDGPVDETITSESLATNCQATIYMSSVRDMFNFLYNGARGYLLSPECAALLTDLENSLVTGSFTIKIIYPESAVIPDSILTGSNLEGFNAAAATTFIETGSRTVAAGATGTKELTITLAVKDGIIASAMAASIDSYLPDITFTGEGISLQEGSNKVVGTLEGTTIVKDVDDEIYKINYTGKQGDASGVTGTEISETVNVSISSSNPGGINAGPGTSSGIVVGTPTEKKDITVNIEIPNAENPEPVVIPSTEKNPSINIDELAEEIAPQREGFAFDGFYDTPTYNNKLTGDVAVTEDITIYARWINTTVPSAFAADSHIKYINGYPDETVRPEANITREEVATIFYRLLKEDVRKEIETTENSFTDIEADRWSNSAISTMANGDYLKGYDNGEFRPEANITRAELATMAYRFLDAVVSGERDFHDIDGHWAEEYIKSIANNEWILGYEDGSFRPDDYITRAEAITIINRIIVRYVDEHGLTGEEKDWIDNDENAWYYYAIIEASNEHYHTRAENGYNEIWSTVTAE